MNSLTNRQGSFGTAPVFMTAISTILGAILFLRFGYAVGNLGFIMTLFIIIIGHMVTIPTAMAVAEIATNQKVEGGGAYYMISRSFGLNIGAAIGIALFLSQAISVSFYIIAFADAIYAFKDYIADFYPIVEMYDIHILSITLPTMLLLAVLMLFKGSDIGVKALYYVVAILFISLIFFFLGENESLRPITPSLNDHIANPDSFFHVFTIIFPAFTGIAAGLGLSGDLKDPKKSIPSGTLIATVVGILVYVAVAYKLAISASPEVLADERNPLIMNDLSLFGDSFPIIPIGLAAATLSSALGSIMIAPRTLQALGADKIFAKKSNVFLSKENKSGEPFNASLVTIGIAFVFCFAGDINFVAEIISMFFMVTYGAICLISFLEHFAADPSYRPSFKSRWYVSLTGFLFCIFLMFSMNFWYAIASIVIMVGIYWGVSFYSTDKGGLAHIFKGVLFQITRSIQVRLQKNYAHDTVEDGWRPFVICIANDSLQRFTSFNMMRWLSHRYGFGTYIHRIEGRLSKETNEEAKKTLNKLLKLADVSKSNVYVDTIISPSMTSAIAQVIQLPGISGKENNMMLFEFPRRAPERLEDVINNFHLMKAVDFDVCILGSSEKGFGFKQEIHIWITANDYANANLMILLGYILLGHPEWKKGVIKIFALYPENKVAQQKKYLLRLITSGRLPISTSNIELIPKRLDSNVKDIINSHSQDADLTIVGFKRNQDGDVPISTFSGYKGLSNILFVNATKEKTIK
jgi:amino acid transporter